MDFLEKLYAGLDPAEVERYEREHLPERPHLEFKSSSGFLQKPTRDAYRADKIAKALGGFANSLTGGVLIYGIKTKGKDAQNYDLADEIEQAVAGLASAISDLVVDGVSPPLTGAKVDVVPISGGRDVVKVLVPSSRNKPHQSLPMHVYYERSIDGFKEMDHAQVELHFRARHLRELNQMPAVFIGPDTRPILTLTEVSVKLVNLGNSPAINLSLSVGGVPISRRPLLGPGGPWTPSLSSSDPSEDTWGKAILGVQAGNETLEVRYQDVAGSRYRLVVPAPYERKGSDVHIHLGNDVTLERDGMAIVEP